MMGYSSRPSLRAIATLVSIGAMVGCTTAPTASISSITIERTACYGHCPVYRFTLYSDGRYVWQGREHVAVVGTARGWMDPSAYTAAMQRLKAARYLEFKDGYPLEDNDKNCEIMATDNPSVRVVVATASRPKTIYHYLGCEGFARQQTLIQLENSLDEVFQTARFIK